MKYTVIAGYNFWFYYTEEGLTFENYHDYKDEDQALELGTLEILDENEEVIESQEFNPEGYPQSWTKGTIVFGIRYSVFEIEADSLSLNELKNISPYSLEYKGDRYWESESDADTLEVINL